MEEIVQYLIIWAPWETRPFVTLDESEVYLFISHIPQVSELRLKPTNKQRDKTIQNQKFLLDPITPVYMKCFFYRSRGKLIINDKTVTRTFDLRNAAQKRSLPLTLPWRLLKLFTEPFFFRKIIRRYGRPFGFKCTEKAVIGLIVGFHMTSLKFKLQNYGSYRNFTFTMY